mmetsp:Transcript_1465/g.2906  ORF Transcript_1465/g.2906 Transcript_1465/m.2906 type:complete len:82 (-) Transcript_1465:421-666(-)
MSSKILQTNMTSETDSALSSGHEPQRRMVHSNLVLTREEPARFLPPTKHHEKGRSHFVVQDFMVPRSATYLDQICAFFWAV